MICSQACAIEAGAYGLENALGQLAPVAEVIPVSIPVVRFAGTVSHSDYPFQVR
jgi:hypothetical protein